MKNMKYKFLILLAVVGMVSCRKDKLSPIPQTTISDLVAFETPERALQTVNGMYSAVKTGQFYGGRYLVYNEIRGEEFNNRTNNGITGFQTYNYTVTPNLGEVGNLWNAAYAAINRINVVINGVQKSSLPDNIKSQYIAEGRFLRGLTYFSLVTLYARPYWEDNGSKPGVIVYTEPQTTSGNNDKARSTVAQTYTQILEDLNFAEQNLPLTYSTATLNLTRAHRNAAIALKTRVYLSMRRYQDVITEANKIVSAAAPFTATTGVQHKLAANIVSVFRPGNTEENIFSFPFTDLDLPGTQNSLNQYFSPSGTPDKGNGDYALNTTANGIVSSTEWSATDARRAFNITKGGQTWLRKWTENTDNVPVIRYAEVLLNLAEALARTNGLDVRAIALLNAVRQRSDATAVLAPATPQALIDAILLERRIELLGEGFRSLDLLRLGQPLPSKPGVATTVATTDAQYIWAIPNGELLVNKAAVQNPLY
ncbi:MAG: RagB/SusD family nutrient uptake outer membrane protein [Bacteroidota bacterium]|nr:RagB/SusD family nutrient uptake outer membrane protein [Bacteroidota bacterium]